MKKVLNALVSGLKLVTTAFLNQYFYAIGLLWMFASFLYIGKPQFWTVLGFGIIFTGVQNIINEIKLNKN
tara:strand:+ start:1287 stop:1496 length:210 start_codon:yes stop_codon:yes gene_type:complete